MSSNDPTMIMVGSAPWVVSESYDEVMGAVRASRAESSFVELHLQDSGEPVSLRTHAIDTVKSYPYAYGGSEAVAA